jgi:circadian clock protein KaiB
MTGRAAVAKTASPRVAVRLYVAGDGPNSAAARHNLQVYLARHEETPVEVEVIDVLLHPGRAFRDGVVVTPTLVRIAPLPERRVIGDLRDTAALAAGLGLGGAAHG